MGPYSCFKLPWKESVVTNAKCRDSPVICFLSQITDIRSKRVNSIARLWKYSFSIKPNQDTITKTFDNICSFLHSEVDTPLLCTMWLVNHFPSVSSPSSVMHTPPSPCLSLFLCLDRSLSSSHINEYSTCPVTTYFLSALRIWLFPVHAKCHIKCGYRSAIPSTSPCACPSL